MDFQEKFKWNSYYSEGSTTAKPTQYYPMSGYRRVDFLFTGISMLESSGALGGTDYQKFTLKLVEATAATGGGTGALSSATAIVGKDAATGVTTAVKCRHGMIFFSTITSAVTLDVKVGTAVFTCATATGAAMQCACASAAAATVLVQSFVTMFNSTADNTSTAITENWYAATEAAGSPWLHILPKDPDGTHLLILGTTGSSQVGVGGVFQAHLGVDVQHMTDGKTHIGLKAYSTENNNPFCVQVLREADYQPVTPVITSKTMGQSTSK